MIKKEPNYKEAIAYIDALISSENNLSGKNHQRLKSLRAGLNAENTVAFKLKSFFADYNDVVVINNLELEVNHTKVQIDHLILTQYNFYVIESKRVSGSLSVNEHGEWTRWYRNQPTPIDSPVEQAKRQCEMLKKFFQKNCLKWQGRMFGFMQKRMGAYSANYFVAVSKGSITGKGRKLFAEKVKKADQVVSSILEQYRKTKRFDIGSFFDFNSDIKMMNQDEFSSFVNFVLKSDKSVSLPEMIDQFIGLNNEHRLKETSSSLEKTDVIKVCESSLEYDISNTEKAAKSDIKASLNEKEPQSISCKHCQATNISIKYGRNYYIRCNECDKNSPLNTLPCSACGEITRVRKQKMDFYFSCRYCRNEKHFFTNQS